MRLSSCLVPGGAKKALRACPAIKAPRPCPDSQFWLDRWSPGSHTLVTVIITQEWTPDNGVDLPRVCRLLWPLHPTVYPPSSCQQPRSSSSAPHPMPNPPQCPVLHAAPQQSPSICNVDMPGNQTLGKGQGKVPVALKQWSPLSGQPLPESLLDNSRDVGWRPPSALRSTPCV